MPRINPINEDTSDPQTKALLGAVRDQMGVVPNIVSSMANSRAALEAYLSMSGALNDGSISAKLQEQIALTVAGANACDYCASAHTMVAGKLGIKREEAERNLAADATDGRAATVLAFASAIVHQRGMVSDDEVQAVRNAGFTDSDIVEIVANVALNIFTNYFNHLAQTEIDFPVVRTSEIPAA